MQHHADEADEADPLVVRSTVQYRNFPDWRAMPVDASHARASCRLYKRFPVYGKEPAARTDPNEVPHRPKG